MTDLASVLARLPPIHYLAIHRANIEANQEPLYIQNEPGFSLCLRPGPLTFSFSVPVVTQKPPIAGMTMTTQTAQLPAGSYWVIEMQFSGVEPSSIRSVATLRVAEAISTIDLRYEGIVLDKLFEGVINTPGGGIVMHPEGPLRLTASPARNPTDVSNELITDFASLASLPADRRERYRLASRWFRRGRETLNPVDKLLFFWTALEIFPAQGTTNVVRKTCELLAKEVFTGLTHGSINAQLKLGRIYRERGYIVHDGKAFVPSDEEDTFSDYVDRLQATAATTLKLLLGLQPGDDLDRYVVP